MLVGRVTAVAPPPIPFPCSSTQIVFTERRRSLKIQSKFCVKKEGGRRGRVGWLAEIARPLDRQFLAFGRTTKSEVGGGK